MRCKNCGFENEPERYICENCGSPLYDENEEITAEQDGYPAENDPNDDTDKKNTRNSIIIIAVLAVLLIAILTGIIIFASQSGKAPEDPSDGISTTETTEPQTEATTEPTTAKPTTTKPTTEPTTQPTTEPTTEPTTAATEAPVAEYVIAVDIDGSGTVTGDGRYKANEKANLVATAGEGYQFVGWYDNATGRVVASNQAYTIYVQKDLSLTARFEPITEKNPSLEEEPNNDDGGNAEEEEPAVD